MNFMSCRLLPSIFLIAFIPSATSVFCNSTCQEDMEQVYMQGIQAKILQGLHLRAPLRNVSIPMLSEEQIEELLASEEDESPKKRVVVLSKPCDINVPGCFTFGVSPSTLQSISRVVIRFFVDISLFPSMRDNDRSEKTVTVVIRRVYADGSQEEVIVESVQTESSQKWEVDVSPTEVQTWKEQGVVGLTVTAEYESDQFVVDGAVKPANANPSIRPTLIIESEPEKKRDRRHAEAYCPPESVDKSCCLHDMIIDFAKLGWHFIMAPKRYNAFMCRGDCRFNSYAGVRFGHSKIMKDSHITGSIQCCHPAEYDALKVIYTRADNEIVITRVPGMIARSCACA